MNKRFLVCTDDILVAAGAISILAETNQFDAVLAEPGTAGLVAVVREVVPAVVLLDLSAEMTFGLIAALRRASPETRIILWSRSFSEEAIEQSRLMGVSGCLKKGCSRELFLEKVMHVVHGGSLFEEQSEPTGTRINLTQRESQLVSLLAQGLRNKEIASCLGITEGTVRIYLSKLFDKVGARDRFELAVFGLKNSHCGQAHWDGRDSFVTESDEGRAVPVLRSLLLVEPRRRRGYGTQALPGIA